jgi:hypothetical protein
MFTLRIILNTYKIQLLIVKAAGKYVYSYLRFKVLKQP